jgi:cytoskeletal protein CcmA (bactofilin family)/DNA-directed RNA polymerase subunit RPC12/RpoP
MAKTTGHQTVVCYHCGRPFDTGERAQSTSCPQCHKRVVIEDVVVTTLKSVTRIQTCGHIVIQPAGRVIAKLVQGQKGVDVQGTVEAKVVSAGFVSIGPKAKWRGDCQARGVSIKSGAKVFGLFAVAGENGGLEELEPEPAPAVAEDSLSDAEHEAPTDEAQADAAPAPSAQEADASASSLPPDAAATPSPAPPPSKPPPRYDFIRHGGRS